MRRWARMVVALGLALALPSLGQASPESVRALGDALQMNKTLAIMAREAEASAQDMAPMLFGDTVPEPWFAAVSKLFDPTSSRSALDAALAPAVAKANAADIAQATAYFQAPFGKRLLDLEISAREALLDADIEAAAKKSWADMLADPLPASAMRVSLIRDVIEAADLIDANVSSALNGNLAFYEGSAEAGGFAADMTADDMLAEVRNQEESIRTETEGWLYSYLAMAYAPLSDQELQDYIDFVKSPAGQALNGVLFLAFDNLGVQQSRGMGLAAGRLMVGQDI